MSEVYKGNMELYQQEKSTTKEWAGKAAKWGGIIGGVIGLLRLDLGLVLGGTIVAFAGRHVEHKNHKNN